MYVLHRVLYPQVHENGVKNKDFSTTEKVQSVGPGALAARGR